MSPTWNNPPKSSMAAGISSCIFWSGHWHRFSCSCPHRIVWRHTCIWSTIPSARGRSKAGTKTARNWSFWLLFSSSPPRINPWSSKTKHVPSNTRSPQNPSPQSTSNSSYPTPQITPTNMPSPWSYTVKYCSLYPSRARSGTWTTS